MTRHVRLAARIALFGAVFGAGYLFATLTQTTAQAQMGDLGKKALEATGGSGGTLGSVAKLGTSIGQMREHLTALNQNVDELEKIKASLGGG
jgi:hypothetical protein